jgi:O-antigen chain-terminating methyltransferase
LIRRLDQLTVIGDTRTQQIASHVNKTSGDIAVALSDGLATLNARVSDVSHGVNQRHTETQQRFSNIKNEFAKLISESGAATKTELREEIIRNAEATRTEFQQEWNSLNTAVRGETVRLTEHVEQATQRLRQEIVIQRARLALLEEFAKKAPAEFGDKPKIVAEPAASLDALYAELEDNFRGNRHTLKQSLRFYLPYVQSLPKTDLNVVDLGCGRGEWLEVLSESGIKAMGVDNNQVMIESCTERSLAVVEADGLAYLREQTANSLRAVTAFHLIEHLPTEELVALLDEIMRTLQPGGVVIFETPNPDNLFVASNYFYHDPTHRHPLPSRLTKFLVESRGFARVEIINLHECAEGRFAGSDEVSVRLNELFYGPMDYAIVGWKHDQ